jgi:pilus assembly protein CpaF
MKTMFDVLVNTKKGMKVSKMIWQENDCHIGRGDENQIVLQGWRVGKKHAHLFDINGEAHVKRFADNCGVEVNGKSIDSYGPIKHEDIIHIGDYCIHVQKRAGGKVNPQSVEQSSTLAGAKKPFTNHVNSNVNGNGFTSTAVQTQPKTTSAFMFDEKSEQSQVTARLEQTRDETPQELKERKELESWRSKVHQKLFDILDLRRINLGEMSDAELRAFTQKTITEILSKLPEIPNYIDRDELARQVLAEAVGLGPLEVLLEREDVSEIMVNAHDQIFFEQHGMLKKSRVTFTNDAAVISAIERIVTPLGRRIDESSPLVDARLKDGSRVNAIIPPLALKGPCITIRKFTKERLTTEHLMKFGSINDAMVAFLETAIVRKRNLVISGGTGSGKTTLLNVLSNFIPARERIVTVEDSAELRLGQPNLVSLEARPANQEGVGLVSIRDLVKNCLRMRPDRIVVGECRGGEALDMLQAMNTGHDGSLTTVHSNSPRDCIARLEVLTMMAGMDLPLRAIREQIASAVNIIVQQTRFSCGSRRITSITEVTGTEGDTVQLAEIFRFRQEGFDEKGKVMGKFVATGIIPEFYEDLRKRGIEIDLSIFKRPAGESYE